MTNSATTNSIDTVYLSQKSVKESTARIKKVLGNFDVLADIEKFREAFHRKKHKVSEQKGYKDLLSAMLGLGDLQRIEDQDILIDDCLAWGEVIARRTKQAESLHKFITLHSSNLCILLPTNLSVQCMLLVQLVQPSASAEDKYIASALEIAKSNKDGLLGRKFDDVYNNLIVHERDHQADVYQALAVLGITSRVAEFCFDVCRAHQREDLQNKVGTIATRWINSEEPAKTWKGIIALSAMTQMGDLYAAVQLARSLFHKVPPHRREPGIALTLIEETFQSYVERRAVGPVFACSESEIELFQCHATIVIDAIRNCSEPEELLRLTKALFSSALEGAEKRMEGFPALVFCILLPDLPLLNDVDSVNDDLIALRKKKISNYPEVESYCCNLAEKLLQS